MAERRRRPMNREAGRERSIVEFLAHPHQPLPRQFGVDEAVERIGALHAANGGATFSLYFGNVAGMPLFAVSVYPDRSATVSGKSLSPMKLRAFIAANRSLLDDPRNNIGTWYDEASDTTWLDISTAVPDRGQALALARQYNQVAIFDLASFETVATGGSGEPLEDLPPILKRLPPLGGAVSPQRSQESDT